MSIRPILVLAATGAVGASLLLAVPTASADSGARHHKVSVVKAKLTELNNSGVRGHAHARVRGNELDAKFQARGLVAGVPHAVHIHHSEQARHECPTLADDKNGDRKLSTVEGVPAYGPVAVSLTLFGDTSPASVLAVTRFSTAPRGKIHYKRDDIPISSDLAADITEKESVVVIHGVDYNGNGTYDAAAGMSELNSSLPREATDPAACGPLR